MESYILHVKTGTRTKWSNGDIAEFIFDDVNVWFKVRKLSDWTTYIVPLLDINKENSHVVAMGFVAYLIHNWGKSETEIYRGFYELCLSYFIKKEDKLPGAFNRDLKAEYYKKHIEEENARVVYSEKIYPYLTDNDSKLISQYTESYFYFIEKEYCIQPLVKHDYYSKLLSELLKYISGINANEFANIIEHHSITQGTPKAKWIGIPADAARFADHFKMGFADFNKLFDLKDTPKLLPNHRQKVRESGESTTSEINTILEKFIP